MASIDTTTTIEFAQEELALVRKFVFDELHTMANWLAEKCDEAGYGGNAEEENVAGEDASTAFLQGVQPAAELLDKLGWSTRTDVATIVKAERARRAAKR